MKNYQKHVIFKNVLPIFKSNLPPEDDVTEKSKVKVIELTFHEVSKNVVVFEVAPWESVGLTYLFSRTQNDYFENRCVLIIIGSTVDFNLGTMQKHQDRYKDLEYFCNLPGNIKSKSPSIFNHNVCSPSKNFDHIHALLTEIDIDFDFIGNTQSCISKTSFSPTNIANYAIEQTTTESNAGGALLHITRKHSYQIQKDLKLSKPHKIESAFVEVIMPKITNISYGCIYRHPDNIDDFNTNYLRPLLQKLSKLSKKIFYLVSLTLS